ncbi:hypothetical protein [Nitrosomonas sp. Nm166]|uniref:beta strand repeat-containing protein n=1 Tax=Nitrosomonas sp. Nm166 TaxID=1881054 RepID=UPI0008E2D7C2|nr:hypothetical protein [Nitrosomonas sp. Nm166]SFE96352.1 hypothetical protein SAMN05428977_10391 [Nitrosomonas sp. Nm166]
MAITPDQRTEILEVVVGLFNAAPGRVYMTELANLYENLGSDTQQLAEFLDDTPVFQNEILLGRVTTDAQVGILMDHFGLEADDDPASAGSQAEAYFTQKLEAGESLGKIVFDAVTYLKGTPAPEFEETATLLDNKVLVAEVFSETNSSTDFSTLQNVLASVPSDHELTRAEAEEIANQTPGTPNTFTLTDDVDALTGTNANDLFIASDTTYNTGDSLNGSGGNDTLNLTLTAANTALVDLTAIENVRIRDVNAGGSTVEASGWDGVTHIWSDRSTENTTVNNVAALAAVGVNQGDGANNFTVNFAEDAVEGDADEVTVALTAADAGTVTIDDVEAFNVNSGGSSENELVALVGDAVETINISGAQDLTITTALANTVTTIDGSAATGDVAIEVGASLAAAGDELSVTLGSGNDTLTTGAVLSTVDEDATGALDGGEGEEDVLAVDAQIDDDVDVNAAITNFEILQIDANVGYDLDGYDWVQRVNLNADIAGGNVIDNIGADVVTNILTNVTDVELSHVNAGKVGTQSLAVDIGGEDAGVTAGTLTIDGVENITINSSGADENTITAMENDALRILTITGDQTLDITTENIQDSVDASEFTGELFIDLAAQTTGIELVIGTGGSNIFVDAADEDAHAITLGAGAVDTLIVSNPDDGTFVDSVASRMVVTGFEGGADVIDFSNTTDAAATPALVDEDELADIQAAVDEVTTLDDAFDAAIGAFTGAADEVYAFEFDGSTYVIYEDGTNAGTFDENEDFVIELVGTDLGLTEDNFLLA